MTLAPRIEEAGDAEGARQLVEEAGAVPCDDVDDRERAIEVVLPFDHRLERADGVGLRDGGEQPVDHPDVQRDLVGLGVDEVAVGEQIEVRGDLVRVDAGDLLRNEFLIDHLLFLTVTEVQGGAWLQALEGSPEEIGVESVLVVVPQAGRGSAGVAEGMDVKMPQPVGVANQFSKCSRSLGIIYVPLLPKACHHEMIFDHKGYKFATLWADLQSFEQREGDFDSFFGVALDAVGLADVMQ